MAYGPALSSAITEILTPEQLEDLAKQEIARTVEEGVNQSVDTLRTNVHHNLAGINHPVANKYKSNLTKAIGGNGNVKVKKTAPRIKGYNEKLGTKRTAISTNGVSAEQILGDPEDTAETLDHENSDTRGHAGQKEAKALVKKDGEIAPPKVSTEGSVEKNMTEDHGARTDQPVEVYKEGEDFANEVGGDTLYEYTAGRKSRADVQVEAFKNTTLDDTAKVEAMKEAGFTMPEMQKVYLATRNAYENGPDAKKLDDAEALAA